MAAGALAAERAGPPALFGGLEFHHCRVDLAFA
jgi:hypothetical protein